jgi:hypothetical protein
MHPIDRLGEIRAQIRALRKEAKEITTKLDAGACTDTGHKFHAKTHLRVAVHPVPPAPPVQPAYNSYQNPLQQDFSAAQQQQNMSGAMPSDSRFGEGRFGHRGYGVGEPAFGTGNRDQGNY